MIRRLQCGRCSAVRWHFADRPGGAARLGSGSRRFGGRGCVACGGLRRPGEAGAVPRADHRQGHAARRGGVGSRQRKRHRKRQRKRQDSAATRRPCRRPTGPATPTPTTPSTPSRRRGPSRRSTARTAAPHSAAFSVPAVSSVVPARHRLSGVGLDGYNSTSVEQLGTDSDCDSGTPSYYAWYEDVPEPIRTLPSQYPVQPGDRMSASVAANSAARPSPWRWRTPRPVGPSRPRRPAAASLVPRPRSSPRRRRPARCSSAARCRWPTSGRSTSRARAVHRLGRDQWIAVHLRRQRDHHGGQRDHAGHAKQFELDGSSFSVKWDNS